MTEIGYIEFDGWYLLSLNCLRVPTDVTSSIDSAPKFTKAEYIDLIKNNENNRNTKLNTFKLKFISVVPDVDLSETTIN